MASKIHFLGKVPYQLLIDDGYFYLGDVFVTMSEFEAQGLSTVEAMSCGLPVVAVDASANSEIVKDVGILFHPEEHDDTARQTLEILNNRQKYREYQKKSILKAQEFSIEQCAKNLEKVYQRVKILKCS